MKATKYQFGPFVLDPARMKLLRNRRELEVAPKPISLLIALVEKRGITVPKDELRRKVWPGNQFSANKDGDLDVLICKVRILLRDRPARPRFILTVRYEGYRFIHSVTIVRTPVLDDQVRSRAVALCRKARHRWNLRTPPALEECLDLYDRAIDEDPNYASAFAGRADAWIMAGIHCLRKPADAFARARADATEALSMDSRLTEGSVAEAWVKLRFDRTFTIARAEFRKALRLKPSYDFTCNGLALVSIALGRPRAALSMMRKAHALNANSSALNALLGDCFYHARNFRSAARHGEQAVSDAPEFPVGHACLGKVHLQLGSEAEAIGHLEKACDLSRRSPVMLGLLGFAYGTFGRRSEAKSIREELVRMRDLNRRYVPPFFLALVHLGLGNLKLALDLLDAAEKERSHWILFLRTEPILDPLREHPRFRSLLRRVHSPGSKK
jgi:DNA-binding winged helix-turn-helix (wHTH) protein/tetratricopeptide (TPR) repeat protein